MTEATNVPSIKKRGLVPTLNGVRGVNYKDASIFFFDSLDPDLIEEVEMVVRFGGVNFEDDEAMDARNIELAILKIDLDVVKKYDEKNQIDRKWDRAVMFAGGHEIITNAPIPPEAIVEYINRP